MSVKDMILKEYKEGKTIEELAEKYRNMSCMAEEFMCDYPLMCSNTGDYCKDCWVNKVIEITKE